MYAFCAYHHMVSFPILQFSFISQLKGLLNEVQLMNITFFAL